MPYSVDPNHMQNSAHVSHPVYLRHKHSEALWQISRSFHPINFIMFGDNNRDDTQYLLG